MLMKKMNVCTLIKSSFLFIMLIAFSINMKAGGYEIKVHIIGLKDTAVYLGNHFGDKQYVKDTIQLDKDGRGVFKGKDSLPGGIYLIVLPNKTYFEIVVKEQKFAI